MYQNKAFEMTTPQPITMSIVIYIVHSPLPRLLFVEGLPRSTVFIFFFMTYLYQ